MIAIVREPVTRIRVKDLEAYATKLLQMPADNPWDYSYSTGHRGQQSIEYTVTGLGGRPHTAIGVLNAACREGLIPAGLVIVDCHKSEGVPYELQRRQIESQDTARRQHFASMACIDRTI